jgi:transposase
MNEVTESKKKPTGRHAKITPEFKTEAVRIALTSGRRASEVAKNLGIGVSTLGKWITAHREADLLSGPHEDVSKELARLRKENEILRAERDLLKKVTALFARETHK